MMLMNSRYTNKDLTEGQNLYKSLSNLQTTKIALIGLHKLLAESGNNHIRST
jgi:hypothetical protein